jgi:uncharacterized membrane protein YjfL (UPF0719 family)
VEIQTLQAILMDLVLMIPYGIIGLLAFLVADYVLAIRERGLAGGKIKSGNTALAIRRFGLLVAIGVGMAGVYEHGLATFVADITQCAIYTALLVVMLHIALVVNDAIVLPGVPNSKAIVDGNNAVALAEVGSLMATGYIAHSVMSGENGDILSTIVFFALGQAVLALSVFVYEKMPGRSRLVKETESGNTAAGILLGAKLWAFGLIIGTAVGGDFIGWQEGLTAFGLTALVGFAFLLIVDWLVDLVILRWDTFKSVIDTKNPASALVFAGGKVGMAYLVTSLIV